MDIKEKVLKTINDVGGCDANCDYDKGFDEAIGAVYDAVSSIDFDGCMQQDLCRKNIINNS